MFNQSKKDWVVEDSQQIEKTLHLFLLLNGHLHFLVKLVDIFLKIIFGSSQVKVLLQTLSFVGNNLFLKDQQKERMPLISCLVLQLGRHP